MNQQPKQQPHKIIFDTDPGVDDAMAFFFADAHPQLQIVGITTIFGNVAVEQSTANTLRLVDIAGGDYPVAAGLGKALAGEPRPYPHWVHGKDGFGDINWPASNRSPDQRPAVDFIIETLKASPGEITLVPVGPLTNIAAALARAPEIAELVREVSIMGGAINCPGNVTPLAEANVANDPEAADAVLGAGWKASLIGLDVTMKAVISSQDIARITGSGSEKAKFLAAAAAPYIDFYRNNAGVDGCCMHDVCALARLVAPEIFTMEEAAIRVACEGFSRGKSAAMPPGHPAADESWQSRPVQSYARAIDNTAMLELFIETLSGQTQP
ncbi:MAG: nucleoside hydrolase [Betaproteobacteria bacterium]|nr:nucleoside hydrolase [Betaproteobacteria bacterium]